jgi:hypothetical protein
MALPGTGVVKSATRIPSLSFPQVTTRKGTHQNNNFLLPVPIADTARTTATLTAKSVDFLSFILFLQHKQDKASVTLSFKDATKLLEGLSKDPQLRADNDPSVLIEEQ